MSKPISGTQAAKIVGVGNNLSFVKKFVETKQIMPIQYPGAKRKLYDPEDVERLKILNKMPLQCTDFNDRVQAIITKHKLAS